MVRRYKGSAAWSFIAEMVRNGQLAIMTPRAQALFGRLPSRSFFGEPEVVVDGWRDANNEVHLVVMDRGDMEAFKAIPRHSQAEIAKEISKSEWSGWQAFFRSLAKTWPSILVDIGMTLGASALTAGTGGAGAPALGGAATKLGIDIALLGRRFARIGGLIRGGAQVFRRIPLLVSAGRMAERGIQAVRRITPLVRAGEMAVRGAQAVRRIMPLERAGEMAVRGAQIVRTGVRPVLQAGRVVRGMVPTFAGSTAGWAAQEAIQRFYTPEALRRDMLPAFVAGGVTGIAEHALHGLWGPASAFGTAVRSGIIGGLGMLAYSGAEQLQERGRVDVGEAFQAASLPALVGFGIPLTTYALHRIQRRIGGRLPEVIPEKAIPPEQQPAPSGEQPMPGGEQAPPPKRTFRVPHPAVVNTVSDIVMNLSQDEINILSQKLNVKSGQLATELVDLFMDMVDEYGLEKGIEYGKQRVNELKQPPETPQPPPPAQPPEATTAETPKKPPQTTLGILAELGTAWQQRDVSKGDEAQIAAQLLQAHHLNAIYELLGKKKRVTEVTPEDVREILKLLDENKEVRRKLKRIHAYDVLLNYVTPPQPKEPTSQVKITKPDASEKGIPFTPIDVDEHGDVVESSVKGVPQKRILTESDYDAFGKVPYMGTPATGTLPGNVRVMSQEEFTQHFSKPNITNTETGEIAIALTPGASTRWLLQVVENLTDNFWPSVAEALKTKHKSLGEKFNRLITYGATEVQVAMQKMIELAQAKNKHIRIIFSREPSDTFGKIDFIHIKDTDKLIPQITIYSSNYMEKLAQLLERSDEALAEAFFTGSAPVLFHEHIHMMFFDLAFDNMGNLTEWGQSVVDWAKRVRTWAEAEKAAGKSSQLVQLILKIADLANQTAKKTGQNTDVVFAEELFIRFATLQTYANLPTIIDAKTAANLQLMETITASQLVAWIKSLDNKGLFDEAMQLYNKYLYPLLKSPISDLSPQTDPSGLITQVKGPMTRTSVLITGLDEVDDELGKILQEELPDSVRAILKGNVDITPEVKSRVLKDITSVLNWLKEEHRQAEKEGDTETMERVAKTMEVLNNIALRIRILTSEDDPRNILLTVSSLPSIIEDYMVIKHPDGSKEYNSVYREKLEQIDIDDPSQGVVPLVKISNSERRQLQKRLGSWGYHLLAGITQRLPDEILPRLGDYLRVSLRLIFEHPENLSPEEIAERKQVGLLRLAELLKFIYISDAALKNKQLDTLRKAFGVKMASEFVIKDELPLMSKFGNLISKTLDIWEIILHPERHFGTPLTPVEAWIRALTEVEAVHNRPSMFFPPGRILDEFYRQLIAFETLLEEKPERFNIPNTPDFNNFATASIKKVGAFITTGDQKAFPVDMSWKLFIYYAMHTSPEVMKNLHKYAQTVVDNFIQDNPRIPPRVRETMTNLINKIGMAAVDKPKVRDKVKALVAALRLFVQYPELYQYALTQPDMIVTDAARQVMGILNEPYALFFVGHFLPALARTGERSVPLARTIEAFLNLRLIDRMYSRALRILRSADWSQHGPQPNISPEDILNVTYGILDDISAVADVKMSPKKITVRGRKNRNQQITQLASDVAGEPIPTWTGFAGDYAQAYGALLQHMPEFYAGLKSWRESANKADMHHLGALFGVSRDDAIAVHRSAQRSQDAWENFQNFVASVINAWNADKETVAHIKQINAGAAIPSLRRDAPIHELRAAIIWHMQRYASLMGMSPDIRTWSLVDFAGFLEYLNLARGTVTITLGDFAIPMDGLTVNGWSLRIIQEFLDRFNLGLSKEDRERFALITNALNFPEMRWNVEVWLNHARYKLEDELLTSRIPRKRVSPIEDILYDVTSELEEGEEAEYKEILLANLTSSMTAEAPSVPDTRILDAAHTVREAVQRAFKKFGDPWGIRLMSVIDAVNTMMNMPADSIEFWKLMATLIDAAEAIADEIQRVHGFDFEDVAYGIPFNMIRFVETLSSIEKDLSTVLETYRSGNVEGALDLLSHIVPFTQNRHTILRKALNSPEAAIDYSGDKSSGRMGFIDLILNSADRILEAVDQDRLPEVSPEEAEAWRRFATGLMLFSGAYGGNQTADAILSYLINRTDAVIRNVYEIDTRLHADRFYGPLLEQEGETITRETRHPIMTRVIKIAELREKATQMYKEIERVVTEASELAQKALPFVLEKEKKVVMRPMILGLSTGRAIRALTPVLEESPEKPLLHPTVLRLFMKKAITAPQESPIPPNIAAAIEQVTATLSKIPDIVKTVNEFLYSEDVTGALLDPDFRRHLGQELYDLLYPLEELVTGLTPQQMRLLDYYWNRFASDEKLEMINAWNKWQQWIKDNDPKIQLGSLTWKVHNLFALPAEFAGTFIRPKEITYFPSKEAILLTLGNFSIPKMQKNFIDAVKQKWGNLAILLNRAVGNIYRSWKILAPQVGQIVEQIVMYLNRLAPVEKSYFAAFLSAASHYLEQLKQRFPEFAQYLSIDVALSLVGLNPHDPQFNNRYREFIDQTVNFRRLFETYAQHRQNNPKLQAREQIKVGWDNETPQKLVILSSNLVQHRINHLAENPEYAKEVFRAALAYRYALDKMYERARIAGIGAKAKQRGEIVHLIDHLAHYYPYSPSQAGAVLLHALGDIWENMDPKEIQRHYGIDAEAAREIWRAISASQHVTSFSHQIQYIRHLPHFWLFIMSDPDVKVALHRYAAELGNLVAEHDAMAIVLKAAEGHPNLENTERYIKEFEQTNPDITPPPSKLLELLVQDSVNEGTKIGTIGVDGYLNVHEAGQQLAMFTQLLHGQFSPVNLHSYVGKGTFQKFVNEVNEIAQLLQQHGITPDVWQRGIELSHSPRGRAQYGRLLHTAFLNAPGLLGRMMSLSTLGVIKSFSLLTGLVNLPEGIVLSMAMALPKDRGFVAQLREIASSMLPLMRAYGKAFQWITSPEFRNIYRNLLRGKIDPEILAKVTDDPVLMSIFSRFIDTYYANIIGQTGAHQLGEFWLHWATFFNFWEMLTLAKSAIFARSYLDGKKDIFLRFIRGAATPEDIDYITRFLGELRLGDIETLNSHIHHLTTKKGISPQDTDAIWRELQNYLVARFVMELHHEYGALDMPELWHASPGLNMAFYWIRSYSLQQGNKLFEHFIKSPYKTPGEKIASALAAFVVASLTYMGMSQIYSAIRGDYEEAPASLISPVTWKGGIWRALVGMLTSPTSPFGILSDTVYALDRMWNTYTPERAARVVFSPLMSLIADSFLTAYSAAQALLTRDEYGFDKLETYAARLIPQHAVVGRFIPGIAETLGGTLPPAEQTARSLYAKLERVYPLTRDWSPNAHQNWITKLLPALRSGNLLVLANLILQTRPGEIFEALQRGESMTPIQFEKFLKALEPVIQRYSPEEYKRLAPILSSVYEYLNKLAQQEPSKASIDLAPILVKLEDCLIEALSRLEPKMRHAVLQHLIIGAVEHAFHTGKLKAPSVPRDDFAITLEAAQFGLVPRLRVLASMAAIMGHGLFREGLIQLSENSPETVDVFLHKFFASEDRKEAFSMIPIATAHTAYRRAFKYTVDAIAPIAMLLFPQLVDEKVKGVYNEAVTSYRNQLKKTLSTSSIRGLPPLDVIKAWEQVCQSEESIQHVHRIHEANMTFGMPFILRLRRFLQGGLTPVVDTLIDATWARILEYGEREARKRSRALQLGTSPIPQIETMLPGTALQFGTSPTTTSQVEIIPPSINPPHRISHPISHPFAR